MIRLFAAMFVLAAVSTARAEEPKFVPFTIDEAAYRALMNYLGDVPARYANPMIAALDQKAREAMMAKAAEEKALDKNAKPSEPKRP